MFCLKTSNSAKTLIQLVYHIPTHFYSVVACLCVSVDAWATNEKRMTCNSKEKSRTKKEIATSRLQVWHEMAIYTCGITWQVKLQKQYEKDMTWQCKLVSWCKCDITISWLYVFAAWHREFEWKCDMKMVCQYVLAARMTN